VKLHPRHFAIIAPLFALASIAAGSTALWGWPTASLIVGALVWIDLFFAVREQSRINRTVPE